uniref:Glutathione synthetase n=1 Tax=Culex pipiens TaxID=7175 RepID=A0A8D8BJZ8_CULPI
MTSPSTEVPILESCIPLPLDEARLLEVVEKAKDWAIMHGAAMRSKADFNPDALQFAPFILTPSSFPRKEFEKAVALQTTLNELMHSVAHDEEFLRDTLKYTIKVDTFTGSLFEIYENVMKEGISQVFEVLIYHPYLHHSSFNTTSTRRKSSHKLLCQVILH